MPSVSTAQIHCLIFLFFFISVFLVNIFTAAYYHHVIRGTGKTTYSLTYLYLSEGVYQPLFYICSMLTAQMLSGHKPRQQCATDSYNTRNHVMMVENRRHLHTPIHCCDYRCTVTKCIRGWVTLLYCSDTLLLGPRLVSLNRPNIICSLCYSCFLTKLQLSACKPYLF